MNWFFSITMALSCAMLLAAQAPDENSVAARRARLTSALHAEWEYTLRTSPDFATSVGAIGSTTASATTPRNPSRLNFSTRARHARI